MRYFDTSFLTPLIRQEETSPRVARFVAGLPTGELAISRWTEVEVASLLARDVRMGVIKSAEAREADALFKDIVRRSFVVLSPGRDDYDLARRYLHNYETGLRAGDALHLAVAGNHRAEMIYSLDKPMIKAGQILGLPVSDGISADL
ncbi:MAG TPA: type II toxin-antitoxin system VapC family toxin [Roseiarcus sp.]|jgi:predicted nucleic acid-binding protein|nr:type II toxin-antitoxin system VapC family toxin [Roseiarcus sp.]